MFVTFFSPKHKSSATFKSQSWRQTWTSSTFPTPNLLCSPFLSVSWRPGLYNLYLSSVYCCCSYPEATAAGMPFWLNAHCHVVLAGVLGRLRYFIVRINHLLSPSPSRQTTPKHECAIHHFWAPENRDSLSQTKIKARKTIKIRLNWGCYYENVSVFLLMAKF